MTTKCRATIYRNGKQIGLHRAMMEDRLGRPLLHAEHVHHINGDPLDNRFDNLVVLRCSTHTRLHHIDNQYAKRLPVTKTCVVCGVAFFPKPTKRRRAQCCSPRCTHIRTSETSRTSGFQPGNKHFRKPLIHPRERPCVICGITFTPDQDHRGRAKVCGRACHTTLIGRAHRKITPDQVATILTMRAADVSVREIAARFGLSLGRAHVIARRGHAAFKVPAA